MLALLVLHLCKVSCLCRCIVQRLGSADISVLAYNFWQAIKASLLWGVAPDRSSAICATASCSGFVWLTASILAWSRGGSPSNIAPARMPGVYAKRLCTMQSQPSIHSPSPRGRGLGIRQGCRDRTPKGFARTQSPQSVLIGIENSHYLIKNRLFLQTEKSLALRQDSFAFLP